MKDPFEYQKPTESQTSNIIHFRMACQELRDAINGLIPPGRCRSLALTKLEECSMWGNKGIVFEESDADQRT